MTPGGCLGLGPASGSVPSLLSMAHPVPALTVGGRALSRGSEGLGSRWKIEQILPSLSEPQSFLQLSTNSTPSPELGDEDTAVSKTDWALPSWAANHMGSELNNQDGKTQDKWAEEEEGKLRRVLRTGLYGEVTFMLRSE